MVVDVSPLSINGAIVLANGIYADRQVSSADCSPAAQS
jgi:hypothetical protein